VKSVLLLDVVHVLASLKLYRLDSLGRLCNWSLNRGSVDDDGLRRACTYHHLGSDHLKLLRIQLNWNLVDHPSGRDDRLDNLNSSWMRSWCCAWLLHLRVWLSLLLSVGVGAGTLGAVPALVGVGAGTLGAVAAAAGVVAAAVVGVGAGTLGAAAGSL